MNDTDPPFLLFGFGPRRRKLVYAGGRLLDAFTLEPALDLGRVRDAEADPVARAVRIDSDGGPELLFEDESGVHAVRGGERTTLTAGDPVRLPDFAGHPHAATLRRMHADLLLCCTPAGPVPNPWVYPRPWYRDAAMLALVFRETGNLPLLRDWILGLAKPYDRNNAGDAEPDNLGQALFLLSLVPEAEGGGASHPLVAAILREAEARRGADGALRGRVDGQERAVYPTKWIRFGLRALGLDDSAWRIPAERDDYADLFWMDFRDEPVLFSRDFASGAALERYPYLAWAQAHFRGAPPPEDPAALPFSREAMASEARYDRLRALAAAGVVPADHAARSLATPHAWHAAEVFLHLLERKDPDA